MAYHALSDNFASFFKRLNPGASFESTASSQYNSIKALIEDRSGAAAELSPTCFLQGSYRQQTAIYNINDIDIVALCRLWHPPSSGFSSIGSRGYSRDEIFAVVAAPILADGRYSSKVRYTSSSMCIKVDLGIKIEILPVVFKSGNLSPDSEPVRLYRPSSGEWSDGFARFHQQYLTIKNSPSFTNGRFIPAIKAFKHLRSLVGLNAVSFHIECFLYSLPDSLYAGGPADYIPELLNGITSKTADEWYRGVCSTPCGDRDIFTGSEWKLEDWRKFHEMANVWSVIANPARSEVSRSKAIYYWQILLGADFFPAVVS